jgi:hypothetical protein
MSIARKGDERFGTGSTGSYRKSKGNVREDGVRCVRSGKLFGSKRERERERVGMSVKGASGFMVGTESGTKREERGETVCKA